MNKRVLYAAIAALWASAASAAPVTYTGFTINDGKLGDWSFHNARVYLTFRGDTKDVQLIHPPIDPADPTRGTVDAWIIQTGVATVEIISGGNKVRATFAPNQLFVSSDLGDSTDAPHIGARGMGFGSVTATGIEPAYPLGIEDGTVDWGDIPENGGNPGVGLDQPVDLQSSSAFSGRAWSCVGFPNTCVAPNPLHTDKGDLLLYSSYMASFDPLAAGFLVVDVGEHHRPPLLSPHASRKGKPISYHAYTVADVQIGNQSFNSAQVYLSYDSDVSAVVPFSNGASSYGFLNAGGRGHVLVMSGGQVVSADFAPGEVYVFYDVGTSSVGFASTAGGAGYPLSITANEDVHGLVSNSSVGAVADLTRTPADASLYTPATATLATDLTNATTLSGAANSCVALDPGTSACANFTPAPLQTNRGTLYLYEDNTDDETGFGTPGPTSVAWGVFWSELGRKGDHDEDGDDDRDDRGSDRRD